MTKSFTSILFGIAVDQGKLSLDDKASKYITQWQGTPSENITVHDLLANVSGRHWDLATDYRKMAFGVPDKTTFAVGLKQDEPPGTKWEYNNSAIQTLQVVLKKATGVEPTDYAQQYIFDPLGMSNTTWEKDGAGNSQMFSGIVSTCLDMARFGLMMLRHGEWKGKQIVSADYVKEATTEVAEVQRRLRAALVDQRQGAGARHEPGFGRRRGSRAGHGSVGTASAGERVLGHRCGTPDDLRPADPGHRGGAHGRRSLRSRESHAPTRSPATSSTPCAEPATSVAAPAAPARRPRAR